MLFSSLLFLSAFLPLTLLAYYLTPVRHRNITLLLCSLAFYGWGEFHWFLLLVFSVSVNFFAGRLLAGPRWRRPILAGTVAVNLTLLAYFKYAGPFLEDSIIAPLLGRHSSFETFWRVSLPLGISFFTFQCISYVVDVYRRTIPPAASYLQFFLYIAMFPHLIAGPIVRFREVREELASRAFRFEVFSEGISRIIIGLGKKVLIANSIGQIADAAFTAQSGHLTASLAWLGLGSYGLQIYFDFSGYSDMAIGLARLFGIHYPENFNYPYAAASVTEFWRRWHITLSLWFRDYLYIPLGGNRQGPWITCANLLLVFLLCGLWHGPKWTFVAWGLMHGCFLLLERSGWGRILERLGNWARIYTLGAVFACWVPFRADSLPGALNYYHALFGFTDSTGELLSIAPFLNAETAFILLLAAIFSLVDWRQWRPRMTAALVHRRHRPDLAGRRAPGVLALAANSAELGILVLAVAQLASQSYNPFIYFRF
jgi:alginate O-acetyltransferase complex protein AlgI